MGGDTDAVLLAEFDKRITLEVGVHLNLVNSRLYLGIGQAVSGEEDAIVAAKIAVIIRFVKLTSCTMTNVCGSNRLRRCRM